MAGVRGRRKAMILFSEGIDYDINDVFNNQGATQVIQDSRTRSRAATRANVSIYAVDPRGWWRWPAWTPATSGNAGLADPNLRLDATGTQNELRLQNDSLRVLAEDTGGFAAINSNDFAGAFDRIQRRQQRLLRARLLPDQRPPGRPIPGIDVKVNRPGVEVRFRKGYAASSGKTTAAKPPM